MKTPKVKYSDIRQGATFTFTPQPESGNIHIQVDLDGVDGIDARKVRQRDLSMTMDLREWRLLGRRANGLRS